MEAVLQRAKSKGVRDFYLLATTASDFFLQCGFQSVARGDAHGGHPSDARVHGVVSSVGRADALASLETVGQCRRFRCPMVVL